MAEYLSPGVYVEDIPNAPVIEQVSSSTGGFLGVAQRGKVGKATYVTSWNSFLTEFASGMSSPFMKNSDLAYSVYGFFQNGGKRCYVQRVAGENASIATASFDDSLTEAPIIRAKDEGEWANTMTLSITVDNNVDNAFAIAVTLNGEVVEYFAELDNDEESQSYWLDVVNNQSHFIEAVSGEIIVADATFSGGSDDLESITDTTYVNALPNFDVADDMSLLCVPGQTSKAVMDALMSYCENRKYVFAILDAPRASTVESVRALRKQLSCANAALYFPYIKVNDPLSKTGKLREVPTCGHVMGVYARTIIERGVWKAPAGTEAVIRGAIEVCTTLTEGDTDVLNPAYINAIIAKANAGIVIWGARCLNPDSSMKYVSDMLLDINIKKSVYLGTQSFVFEPNSHETWTKVETTVQSFLDIMWRDGALYGETASAAYYVKCDEDLNTEAMQNAGRMICEVGYRSKKPAEFVIFRFSHNVAASN